MRCLHLYISPLSKLTVVHSILTLRTKYSYCVFTMFKSLDLLLLLLFCFVYQSGIIPEGDSLISVRGQKGGSVTLPCQFQAKKISDISLNSLSESIPFCQQRKCSGRVSKRGNCDVVIKDLSFSDAGTYFLHVYYHNDQADLERQIRTYQLHIHDEISVKVSEELKLEVLLLNADKVQHESRSSTELKEVWSRRDGVWRDPLTDTDGSLIINEFAASDAGIYIVLDSKGECLITVTVKASSSERKEKAPHLPDPGHWSLSKKLTVFFVIWGIIVVLTILIVFWVSTIQPISVGFGFVSNRS